MTPKAPTDRAVVAVLLPAEHLPFIRQWCLHHLEQGWRVVLYDNTGSIGSTRVTSRFHTHHWNPTRSRWWDASLTDDQARDHLAEEVRGLDVTIIPWQPRDARGSIMHGQVEAYANFVARARQSIRWAAFIDADEYLVHGQGLNWAELLDEAENQQLSRILLSGELFEHRWSPDGRPRALDEVRSCGVQVQRNKNILRLEHVTRTDVHWSWRVEPVDHAATPNDKQFWFRHYRHEGTVPIELTRSPHVPGGAINESVPVGALSVITSPGPVRRGGVTVTDEAGGITVVTRDASITLGPIGATVFELADGRTPGSIADGLAALTDLDAATALQVTTEAIHQLREVGLVL